MSFDPETILDRRQPSRGARQIPESVANEIITEAVEASAILSLARTFRMASYQHRMPVMSAFGTAFWKHGTPEDTLGEGGDGSTADKDSALKRRTTYEWDNVFVVPDTLNVLVPIPDEWMDDSNITWEEVRREVVREFSQKIDEAVLFGAGNAPQFFGNGIVNDAVAAGNVVAEGSGEPEGNAQNSSGAALSDLALDIATLGERANRDGVQVTGFASEAGFRWRLRRLRGSDGQPILSERDGQSFLYDQRLQEVRNSAWDSAVALLVGGEWDKLAVGIRQDVGVRVFDQATLVDPTGGVTYSAVQQDGKVLRATMRLGYAVANPVRKLAGGRAFPFYTLTPQGS